MIPKLIHQIWIGDKKSPSFMGKWKENHPSWSYLLWTEREIDSLVMRNQDFYDAMNPKMRNYLAGKSDIARMEILYRHGGIYIDADIECLRPMEGDFLDGDFFGIRTNDEQRGDSVNPAVMGAIAHHPFINMMIDELAKERKLWEPLWDFCGPGLMNRCLEKFPEKLNILPSYYFEPDFHSGKPYKGKFKPFGYHFWGSTKKLYGKL